jgi:hypothetical protein
MQDAEAREGEQIMTDSYVFQSARGMTAKLATV